MNYENTCREIDEFENYNSELSSDFRTKQRVGKILDSLTFGIMILVPLGFIVAVVIFLLWLF